MKKTRATDTTVVSVAFPGKPACQSKKLYEWDRLTEARGTTG